MILTFEVTLFGSLAATGKGHLTDVAIKQVFKERKIKIIWKPEIFLNRYPNGMTINAIKEEKVIDRWTTYSIGGDVVVDENSTIKKEQIYELSTMKNILAWVEKRETFWGICRTLRKLSPLGLFARSMACNGRCSRKRYRRGGNASRNNKSAQKSLNLFYKRTGIKKIT